MQLFFLFPSSLHRRGATLLSSKLSGLLLRRCSRLLRVKVKQGNEAVACLSAVVVVHVKVAAKSAFLPLPPPPRPPSPSTQHAAILDMSVHLSFVFHAVSVKTAAPSFFFFFIVFSLPCYAHSLTYIHTHACTCACYYVLTVFLYATDCCLFDFKALLLFTSSPLARRP